MDGEGLTKLLHRAKVLDCKTAMDITGNPTRRSAAQLLPALPNLDFFLPSAYEAMDLSGRDSPGKAADYFMKRGSGGGGKMGGQGALLSAGGKQEVFPAYEARWWIPPSGRRFVAGFLAALSGESPYPAVFRSETGQVPSVWKGWALRERCLTIRN